MGDKRRTIDCTLTTETVCFFVFFTRVVVGESSQKILLPIRFSLQMHLAQTTEHLWTHKKKQNVYSSAGREPAGRQSEPTGARSTHLSSWVDRCYTLGPSRGRSDSSTRSRSPPCRSSARCRSSPRRLAGNTRLCELPCDLGERVNKKKSLRVNCVEVKTPSGWLKHLAL